MPVLAHKEFRSDLPSRRTAVSGSHRYRSIRVLFVHRDAETVEHCLQELKKARFLVSSDVVLTLAQCTEQLQFHEYDVVIAEFPSPRGKGPQVSQLLQQKARLLPLVLITSAMVTESVAQLAADGAFDYVEREHLAQLPLAVRRVLATPKETFWTSIRRWWPCWATPAKKNCWPQTAPRNLCWSLVRKST